MNRLALACCLFIVSCGANIDLSNSDAGPDAARGGSVPTAPPPEQQVSTSLSSWCPQICAKMVQCQMPGTNSDCVQECTNTMTDEFVGHGNTCAQFGVNFMNCLNGATCSELNGQNGVCDFGTTAEEIACGNVDTSAPVVTCQSGSGIATAGGSVPIGAMVCQNNASGCTDGHSYSIDCINAGNNQSSCTCFRDGANGVTFGASGTSCPNVSLVNAYCGWQLASI